MKQTWRIFLILGNSSRLQDKETIGEKGHGTKVYFNSKKIQIKTTKDNLRINAEMSNIFTSLNQGLIPDYQYEIISTNENPGTEIIIFVYNLNKYASFKYFQVKDYILWRTKFGAIDKEFGIEKYNNIKIYLKGLDMDEIMPLYFGHIFPQESVGANKLYEQFQNEAPDYFCKKWIEVGSLSNFPHIKYQAVFFVEGKHVNISLMRCYEGKDIRLLMGHIQFKIDMVYGYVEILYPFNGKTIG